MARSSSGIVAGLTAAALAAVGFLAYQASANAPDQLGQPREPPARRRPPHGAAGAKPKPSTRRRCPPTPAPGVRVVYALGDRRVWLVGADGQGDAHLRGHAEHGRPGARAPTQVHLALGRRSPARTGCRSSTSCGSPSVDGVPIGFSAARGRLDGEPGPEAGRPAASG